jgi:superfamily II DNA or RNA helicase
MSVATYQQPIPLPVNARPALALRPYQEAALTASAEALGRGVQRQLIALPTGAGKTVVFAHLTARRGGKTLILAHRDELIQQAADKLRWVMPLAGVGVVKAEADQHQAPVVVASVQTLARTARLHRLPRQWDTVIVDEAHHVQADSYQRVLDYCGAFGERGPLTLGVTATPERADGKPLGATFQEIVYQRGILEMILEGYLVDLRAVQVRLAADFSQVGVRAGDYVDSEMETTLLEANAPEHAARAYLEHAKGRKALLFTPTVKVAHRMAEQFREAGVPSEAIDGSMDMASRRAILRRFHDGETLVLANCAVLTEGYDEPSVDCVIIARPTKSRPLYVQMIGRGTRLHPGKDDALVIDLVGASSEHSLVTLSALFNLNPDDLEGATVSDAVARKESSAKRQQNEHRDGRLVAAEVDLFKRSALHWIELGATEFVLPLGNDMLWLAEGGDGWNVVRRTPKTRQTTVVASGVSLEYAQGIAEDVARQENVGALIDPNARWRQAPASDKQLAALVKWGVAIPREGLTKGEASDLMTIAMATRGQRR